MAVKGRLARRGDSIGGVEKEKEWLRGLDRREINRGSVDHGGSWV